jgi:hypothetical protein
MIRRGFVVGTLLAGLAAYVFTVIPLLWRGSPCWEFLAWPGMALSGLLGANDKWGLPNIPLYLVGGTLFWAAVLVLTSALAIFLRKLSRPLP